MVRFLLELGELLLESGYIAVLLEEKSSDVSFFLVKRSFACEDFTFFRSDSDLVCFDSREPG